MFSSDRSGQLPPDRQLVQRLTVVCRPSPAVIGSVPNFRNPPSTFAQFSQSTNSSPIPRQKASTAKTFTVITACSMLKTFPPRKIGSETPSRKKYARVVTRNLSSSVGGRPRMSAAQIAAPWVDNPGISAARLSSRMTPIQKRGPGRQRRKPVKTGSPQ